MHMYIKAFHITIKFCNMYIHAGAVDYAMFSHDPSDHDLWVSTPEDQFPDPSVDPDGFMVYCGESLPRLTAYLWLVTREMIEKREKLKPIAMHKPFISKLVKIIGKELYVTSN